jgi:molybdenum cofactor cytidylyltransferase
MFVGLLLAAGSASRFGSDKLQHPLPHGVAIAVQAARHLKFEIPRVVAVVRDAGGETARALEAEGCEVAVCANAAEGMGASLACGARAAGAAGAYLVALADMPFVRRSTIAAVRDALAGGALLAAPYFRARRGHPVGFNGALRSELEALSGDDGAKRIVEIHAAQMLKVPVGDPGAIRDIDRPADLAPPLAV